MIKDLAPKPQGGSSKRGTPFRKIYSKVLYLAALFMVCFTKPSLLLLLLRTLNYSASCAVGPKGRMEQRYKTN